MKNEVAVLSTLPVLNDKSDIAAKWTTGLTPWLKIMSPNSGDMMKNPTAIGKFCMYKSQTEFAAIGATIIVIPLSIRYKAIDLRNPETIFNFEPDSAGFREIVSYCDNNLGMNCKGMYGSEILNLVLIDGTWQYVTHYLCNTTLRGSFLAYRSCMRTVSALSTKLIQNKKKQQWYGIDIISSPQSDLPPMPSKEELISVINKFTATDKEVDQPTIDR